jgi:hypothetical protein
MHGFSNSPVNPFKKDGTLLYSLITIEFVSETDVPVSKRVSSFLAGKLKPPHAGCPVEKTRVNLIGEAKR